MEVAVSLCVPKLLRAQLSYTYEYEVALDSHFDPSTTGS